MNFVLENKSEEVTLSLKMGFMGVHLFAKNNRGEEKVLTTFRNGEIFFHPNVEMKGIKTDEKTQFSVGKLERDFNLCST